MKHLTILIILLHISFIPWSQPDISWEEYYNGQANMDDNLSDMIVDYSGNVYITGTSNNGINTDIVTQKYSPAGEILWTHVYNGGSNSDEVAKVIREDNVGNIYVGGESYVDEEGFNMLLLKYDSNGNLLWFTMANNPGNSDDKLNDLTIDSSNNVYCVGNFGNNGGIVVYPPNGGLPLWNYTTDVGTYYYTEYLKIILTNTGEAKVLSNYGNEFINQVHIVTFSSLGLYQGYYYYSAPVGSQAFATDMVLDASGIAYVSCYEASFDQDITKIISTASFPSEVVATYDPVASGNAHPTDIKRDNFGNIYITGFEDLNSSVVIDNNILTIKFNSDGVQQWVEHYGQIGDDRGIDLAIVGGEAYVFGYNTQMNGTQDIIVLRYSSVGNLVAEYPLIYENQANSTDLSDEIPVSLHVSSPSSLLVAGITNSSNANQNNDFLVVKYCTVTGGFNVGDDLSICQDSEQQLAAVGNGSFLWSPATWLSTPSVSNPIVSIPFNASPDDYIYSCTFTDEFGCSTLTEVTITVIDTPSSPSILINGPNAFCEGGSVMLFATGASGHLWSPNFEEESVITVTASGIYSVTISENGCTSNPSNSIEVEVYPNPAVAISPSGNISFCDDGILTANTIGGQPEYTYNWMNSNSATSTTVVNETGTYSVEVTDEHGCSGLSLPVVVQVYPTPASPAVPQYSADSVCAPDIVTLFVEGEGVFSWYMDDMLLTNSESATYLANTLGSHSYSTTVMIDGCVSAQSESVLISVFPQNEVTILPNPATFCIDDSVTLVASNTNGNYAWSPGGETTDAITVYEEGLYHVTSIDNNGCIGEDIIAVEALASPPIPNITNIDNLILESSALQGNQWFLNGEPIPGATDQQFVPSVNGSYSVTVTLEGCDSPQSVNYNWIYISVNSEYQFNDYLKLYPNPTSSICFIEGRLPVACNFRIRIINSLGQVEYENSEYINSTEFLEKISLNVSNGMYHVLVLTDLGTLSTGLLIIKD